MRLVVEGGGLTKKHKMNRRQHPFLREVYLWKSTSFFSCLRDFSESHSGKDLLDVRR